MKKDTKKSNQKQSQSDESQYGSSHTNRESKYGKQGEGLSYFTKQDKGRIIPADQEGELQKTTKPKI